MSAGLKEVLIKYLQNDNPGDKAGLKQYIDFGKFQSFKKRVVRNFNQQKGDNIKALEYNNKSFKDAYANPESRDLIANIIRDLPMGYKSESPPPTTAVADNDEDDVTGSGSSSDPYLQTARVPKYLEKNVNKQLAKQQRRAAMQQTQGASTASADKDKLQPIQTAPVSAQGPATVAPVAQTATQSQPAQIPVDSDVQPPQTMANQSQESAIQGPVQPGQQIQQGAAPKAPKGKAAQKAASKVQGNHNAQAVAQAQADAQIQAVAKAQQMQLQQAQQLLQLQAQAESAGEQPVASNQTTQQTNDSSSEQNSAPDATKSDVGTKRKANTDNANGKK